MDIQYKDPFTPHVLCEPGDGERGGILKQEVIMLNFLPELSQSDFSANREFIFVIDRSGSMIGSNMHNACEALLLFLKSLPAGCYFNIVSFGSDYKFLFEGGSVEYNETNLHKAETCQRKMSADMGGTEIYEPLREIYNRPPLKGFSRQIFVLTDGEVCDTKRVVRLVKQNATNSRVFAVGIGEGASTALIRGIARAGRGQAEFVTGKDRLQAKVMKLLSQALQSSVSDLKLDWSGARVSGQELVVPPTVVPQPIPPVFHGSRLILYILFESLSAPLSGTCTLIGSVEGREISFELDLSDLEKLTVNEGHLPLHRLAAKAQIKQLEVQLNDGSVDREEKSRLKTLITMLSMSANVVSSKTAFVGYDRERKIVSAKTRVHTERYSSGSRSRDGGLRYSSRGRGGRGGRGAPRGHKRLSKTTYNGGSFKLVIDVAEIDEDGSDSSSSSRSSFESVIDVAEIDEDGSDSSSSSRSRSRERSMWRRSRSRSRSRRSRFRSRSTSTSRTISKFRSRSRSGSPARRSISPRSLKTCFDVLDVVRLQRFTGEWELTEELCEILGKGMAGVQGACPVKDPSVWATALVLAWLKLNYAARHDEWAIIELKATRWLHKQQNITEGSSLEKFMEEAEHFLKV